MPSNLSISAPRIQSRLFELGQIGRTGSGGVTRLALSQEDLRAQDLVSSWMRQAGMEVQRDYFGNLIGRKEGEEPKAPAIVIGSHIDSVPNGGRFDGTLGVIGGIEVVQVLHDANIRHKLPIEVVAFCDEEGARFESGLFGSRGMVGRVTDGDLNRVDGDGISRYEALCSAGVDPRRMADSIRRRGDIEVYLEMHIEQGPFLESIHQPVGIVTGIAGVAWLTISLIGEAGHAGTVPMNLRRDPMMGAAEVILAVERACKSGQVTTTVGTVGKIHAQPGSSNVIPGKVEFTVDIRDIEQRQRDDTILRVKSALDRICRDRSLEYRIEEGLNIQSVQCSTEVVGIIEESARKLHLDPVKMVSGAGHDAMAMADICDVGMIFVRCRNGISHHPAEWASPEDMATGTRLLLETVLSYIES